MVNMLGLGNVFGFKHFIGGGGAIWAGVGLRISLGTVCWRLQSGESDATTFTGTVRYLALGLGLRILVQDCPCARARPNPTVLSAID